RHYERPLRKGLGVPPFPRRTLRQVALNERLQRAIKQRRKGAGVRGHSLMLEADDEFSEESLVRPEREPRGRTTRGILFRVVQLHECLFARAAQGSIRSRTADTLGRPHKREEV